MAANIEVKIEANNIEKIKAACAEQVSAALEAIGMQAENYAKKELERPKAHADGMIRPNIDTSRLVNSITHAVENGDTAIVGTNVEYAAYVEIGTQKSQPYPYLEPAVKNHIDEYKRMFEYVLQNGN